VGIPDTPTRSADLVQAWSASADAVLELVGHLDDHELVAATDLPGWNVRDILAHLAHLESELAGEASTLADESEIPADARDDPFRAYTERGVAARRARTTTELIAELERAVHVLRQTLEADEPGDPPASFPRPGTTWEPLLRDRTLDYWMHEQDIRRAVGHPGGWDSPGAELTVRQFAAALPYVVGKKVRPPAGTTVAFTVTRPAGADEVTIAVGEDGRARVVDVGADDADVHLSMSVQDFVLACGGRRSPDQLDATVDGDAALGAAVLAAMSVTP
jgi:uncharacterized protein (TIGR03083 family)